jgi:hypothetical protein
VWATDAKEVGVGIVRSQQLHAVFLRSPHSSPDQVIPDGFDPRHILGGDDDGVKALALVDAALEALRTKRVIAL